MQALQEIISCVCPSTVPALSVRYDFVYVWLVLQARRQKRLIEAISLQK